MKSIGQPSEVLLVLDQKVMGSDLKDSLKAMLEVDVPGLNQKESFFRVTRVPVSIYRDEMMKMHTKLLVKVDDALTDCDMAVARDVNAKPQMQVLVTGPSVDALRTYLNQNAGRIRELLVDHQIGMQTDYIRRKYSAAISEALKPMGFTGRLPEEIAKVKKGEDFVWASSQRTEKQLNFAFYLIASEDGRELGDVERMVQLRDSVMQVNIPGSREDQWMETVWENEQPVVVTEERQRNGMRVLEIRGLWQMHNGAMGGPFVSYSWYDAESARIVVTEGFVYSPSTEKRDLVRQLEAGLRTIHK